MFTDGCAPRVTLLGCDAGLRAFVKWGKVMTCVCQVASAAYVGWSMRPPEERRGLRGSAQAIGLCFCALGAAHSLVIAVPLPGSLSQHAGLIAVEFLYSLYNAILISGLGALNCIWLEVYFVAACPGEGGSRLAATVRRARACAVLLLVATVVVAVATDAYLAAEGTDEAYVAAIHAQHWCFAVICTLSGSASCVAASSLMRRHGIAAQDSPAHSAEGGGGAAEGGAAQWRHRARIALRVVLFLWAFCATFCLFCATFGHFEDPNDPHSGALATAWSTHAAFILGGGSIFASAILVLLHSPEVFDGRALAALCCLARARPPPQEKPPPVAARE